MAMNDKPCQDCKHYDVIARGDGTKKGRQGWCAVKSVYHHQEQPGQLFPLGVKRAAPGELAQPVIVTGSEIQPLCTQFSLRR